MVKVGMHQGSVLSPFFLWWWMLSLYLPEGVLGQLLYADDLVLMSEAMEELVDKFMKKFDAFECETMSVYLGKQK